jgi:tRNA nucleotidyltransferase (CCA-adding enzyme)
MDKNNMNIKKILKNIFLDKPIIERAVTAIQEKGGRALLVGGAVRDFFLDLPVKDIDIEVHGITLEHLELILKQFRPVSLVGKSFGVLRMHGLDVDWSLPRTDSAGRKPQVSIDPFMSFDASFRRRDLTMNAMGIDLGTGLLIDPFNGLHDLQSKILRTPDPKLFGEDPLRLFRVMQFIGRFAMYPDPVLNELCSKMDISGVSRERIVQEFEKLMDKSSRPSLGFRWLAAIGRLKEILPELAATMGVPQEASWHPEGDVFEHTMQAIDAAACLSYETDEQKKLVVYAALCHDLGKATMTQKIDGRWRSIGHDVEGAAIAPRMLARIVQNKDFIKDIALLVRYHMVPFQLVDSEADFASYKRLAKKIGPHVSLKLLAMVALADKRGRNDKSHLPLMHEIPALTTFIKRAQQAGVYEQAEAPLLTGRDLEGICEPGPQMVKILRKVYEKQLAHGIEDKETLRAYAAELVKSGRDKKRLSDD